jgi:N-acetylglutamate synthase-like GNAT family acetyltransferase
VLVRDYRSEDLAQILQLWEQTTVAESGGGGVAVEQAIRLLSDERAIVLVADTDGRLDGAVLAALSPLTAWIYQLSLRPEGAYEQMIAERLLEQLEARVSQGGIRTLAAVTEGSEQLAGYLRQRGYRGSDELRYFERDLLPPTAPTGALVELGGQLIGPGLWDALKGMEEAKEIIERRVILPLAEPELAGRHGVVPPRAIVLFGPPGAGKTTFAKGIASRLGWPFVEVLPAELAGEGAERQAKLLADAFERILELASAVVFVDEVEDLAATRHEERRVTPSITNEFSSRSRACAAPRTTCSSARPTGSPASTPPSCAPAASTTCSRSDRRTPTRAGQSGAATSRRSPTSRSTSRRSCARASSSHQRTSSSQPARPPSAPSSASISSAHPTAPVQKTSSPRSPTRGRP